MSRKPKPPPPADTSELCFLTVLSEAARRAAAVEAKAWPKPLSLEQVATKVDRKKQAVHQWRQDPHYKKEIERRAAANLAKLLDKTIPPAR